MRMPSHPTGVQHRQTSDDTKSEGTADGMQGLEAAGSCSTSDLDPVSVQRAAIMHPLSRGVQPLFPHRLVTPDEHCCLARFVWDASESTFCDQTGHDGRSRGKALPSALDEARMEMIILS